MPNQQLTLRQLCFFVAPQEIMQKNLLKQEMLDLENLVSGSIAIRKMVMDVEIY